MMKRCVANNTTPLTEPPALTLQQFSGQAAKWYQKYAHSPYFDPYIRLEQKLSQKASDEGYLELVDLADIAAWGGNQRAIKQRLLRSNNEGEVRQATLEAIQRLDKPSEAIRVVLRINQWGLTYASKTLRCVCPQNYPALDQKLRKAISKALLPTIYDGNIDSMIRGYLRFLKICREIERQVTTLGPRSGGVWFLADIEMALFQFVWDGGRLISSAYYFPGVSNDRRRATV